MNHFLLKKRMNVHQPVTTGRLFEHFAVVLFAVFFIFCADFITFNDALVLELVEGQFIRDGNCDRLFTSCCLLIPLLPIYRLPQVQFL